jgi:hypothetical protein
MNSASVPSPHRLFKNSSSGYIGWRNSFLGINSWAPQTFKNTGSGTQEKGGGEEGGRGAEGRKGIGGVMTSHLEFWVQMFTICLQKTPNNTLSSLFRGVGWVCIFLEIDRAFEFNFGKLLGKIEFEFLRNLKDLVEFEVRA